MHCTTRPALVRWPSPIASCLLVVLVAASLNRAAGDEFQPTAQETIAAADAKLELVWAGGEFTEGPTLSADGSILFSDIGNRILRFEPMTSSVSVYRENSGKSNGLMFNPEGLLVACEGAHGGNRRVSITDAMGQVHTLADTWESKRFNSPNDLAIGAQGQVYFTDPRYGEGEPRELDFEGVFLVKPDRTVLLATKDVQRPNGILITSDDQTVYVADSHSDPQGNHQLLSFTVQADGTLANKKVLFDFGPNRRGIDGMTLDQQGNIYATAGTGELAGVYVFDPQGKPLALIRTPGSPTNCVFGGGDEKSTLYITAAVPATDDQKPSFGLYRIKLNIDGHHLFPPN